ncbi:MAG: ABC transporter ATP-binding protein [Lachnospiraceae bacterium]|nr:ABC transporter ATP-binding protein [Lachnospiraceae bacterium]
MVNLLKQSETIDENKNPFIVCDGLVKIFKTDEIEVMALQGLDMEIEQGEMLSVIGKSGSGKSTLMNIIGGLEKPSAGKIIVDGKNLSDMTEKEMVLYRKKKVGFVWQKSERNLFPYLTSIENIEAAMNFTGMSAKEKKEWAMELLEMVGMSHRKDSYPRKMSGGEQQRIAIAVALANKPVILLADEPTGAVDSKTSNMIQDLFRKLNREMGITIIIVTHDMKLANKVDRVVMISDGKISTEKIMKDKYREQIDSIESEELGDDSHEEYAVMDKARRVQLNEEMLREAGIDTNKVKVKVEDGRVIIEAENK